MHRFFLPEQPLQVGAMVDLTSIRHQLARVLRVQPGDEIVLLNGDGHEYLTQVAETDGERATGAVMASNIASGEPATFVTLYQCALKADKMEWVLQKGTELGVSRFVPVVSERTIVRPAAKIERKYARWRAILREAAEQCRRGRIPQLDPPADWPCAAGSADSEGAVRLLPWEAAAGVETLARALSSAASGHAETASPRVSLLIGPEGGITEQEMVQAAAAGWRPVTLGPRILRAETAALAAISIAMSTLGEME